MMERPTKRPQRTVAKVREVFKLSLQDQSSHQKPFSRVKEKSKRKNQARKYETCNGPSTSPKDPHSPLRLLQTPCRNGKLAEEEEGSPFALLAAPEAGEEEI